MRQVVDTHIHFWDLDVLPYPWLDDVEEELRSNYLPQDLLADMSPNSSGVDVIATVHVQAEVDHAIDPALETRWLAELAETTGMPTAAIGYADLRAPDLGEVLDRHAEHEIFRGIRQEAWFDPESTRADVPRFNLLDDPAWRNGLRALDERGLVFELLVWQSQLDQASRMLAELPGVTTVVEHTGLPIDPEHRASWRTDLAEFARRVPRSALKISGLAFVDPAWTPAVVDPLIRESIQLFGPERCILASNFPVDKPGMSYEQIWETFERCTDDLTAAEQDALFRTNALALYRIA